MFSRQSRMALRGHQSCSTSSKSSVTVTSVSLPPFVSRRGLSNTNQRLSHGISHEEPSYPRNCPERERERERGRGRGRERGGGRETERGDCKTAVRDDRRGSSVVARRASCWDELENSWERQPRRRVTADLSQISTFTQNRHVARLVETPLRSSLWARAKRAYLADLGSMVL